MASLMVWANEAWPEDVPLPFEHEPPRGVPHRPTRLQVLAALSEMDRGGYGVQCGGGIYGRVGLSQEEAFVWWDLRAYTSGWLAGTDNAESEVFFAAIKAERDRVRALPPHTEVTP